MFFSPAQMVRTPRFQHPGAQTSLNRRHPLVGGKLRLAAVAQSNTLGFTDLLTGRHSAVNANAVNVATLAGPAIRQSGSISAGAPACTFPALIASESFSFFTYMAIFTYVSPPTASQTILTTNGSSGTSTNAPILVVNTTAAQCYIGIAGSNEFISPTGAMIVGHTYAYLTSWNLLVSSAVPKRVQNGYLVDMTTGQVHSMVSLNFGVFGAQTAGSAYSVGSALTGTNSNVFIHAGAIAFSYLPPEIMRNWAEDPWSLFDQSTSNVMSRGLRNPPPAPPTGTARAMVMA